MVLNHGRTQQVAAPTEAYLKPANRFVAEFLGIANFVGLDGGRTGLVRPERVRLEPIGANGGRPARVVEAIYLGQMVRYHLALDGGEGAPMVAAVPFVGRAYAGGRAGLGVVGCGRSLAGGVREQQRGTGDEET